MYEYMQNSHVLLIETLDPPMFQRTMNTSHHDSEARLCNSGKYHLLNHTIYEKRFQLV